MRFHGVYSVLPTPFHADGSLDIASLHRVTDLYVKAGIDGLTTLGVTSEAGKLSESERRAVLEAVIKSANGRVPVVAGATADGLRQSIEYSHSAQASGAAAIMVSPPRMAQINSDAVFNHYLHLAAAISIPIVVQDFPPVSGYAMEPVLLARIAREIPQARAIKLEDPPTPLKTARILEACAGIEVDILGGLGGVYLFEELLAGASGAMTGFAYPEMLVDVVRLYRAGDQAGAAGAFYRYVPLMRFEFQQGIGIALRKEVLRRRGVIADTAVRPPAGRPDAVTLSALDEILRWMRNQGVKWISA